MCFSLEVSLGVKWLIPFYFLFKLFLLFADLIWSTTYQPSINITSILFYGEPYCMHKKSQPLYSYL